MQQVRQNSKVSVVRGNSRKLSPHSARSSARMRLDYLLNDDRDEGKVGATTGARCQARPSNSIILGDVREGETDPIGGSSHSPSSLLSPSLLSSGRKNFKQPIPRHRPPPLQMQLLPQSLPQSQSQCQSQWQSALQQERPQLPQQQQLKRQHSVVEVEGITGRASSSSVSSSSQKEKKFECDICGFAFGMKSNLKRHVMTVHEDRRGWHCNICGASFGLKQNLGTHVRVKHEKKRPFTCDACGVSFGYKQVLQNHRRNIHGHTD